MHDSYIRLESSFEEPYGDSSTIDYKFSLSKSFCAEELIMYLRGFLEGTFTEDFVEEVVENFSKSEEELEEGIEEFYKELEEDVYNNPEKYGITPEDLNTIDEALGREDREGQEIHDVSNVEEFKKQLDNNPQFLKQVFRGYVNEILKD